mgnify:CR=1 FL=1
MPEHKGKHPMSKKEMKKMMKKEMKKHKSGGGYATNKERTKDKS